MTTTPHSPSQLMKTLPWKRVFVPIDFSPPSEAALVYALKLAQLIGAEVEACHIIPTPHVLDALYERGFTSSESVQRIIQKARTRIKEIAEAQETSVPLRIHCQAEEGEAAEHILQQANNFKADLIVMGTHGRSGVEHFFLGSVAETVIRRASCPVLTVRS